MHVPRLQLSAYLCQVAPVIHAAQGPHQGRLGTEKHRQKCRVDDLRHRYSLMGRDRVGCAVTHAQLLQTLGIDGFSRGWRKRSTAQEAPAVIEITHECVQSLG